MAKMIIQGGEVVSGLAKVATVLVALGPEVSSTVLQHFDDAEVEQIAYEISNLRRLAPNEIDFILNEFFHVAKANEYMMSGGLKYTQEVLEKAFGSEHARTILGKLQHLIAHAALPFEGFRQADPSQVANLIQNEHPQTIALIMAYLRPEQAAVVIANLPEDLQIEVSTRMATMERAGLEVVKEVEGVLQDKYSAYLNKADRKTAVGGVKALAEVLNRVDRSTERNIVENLERIDPELAESVKKLMFMFEDLVQLDDRAIQRVLREVDTKELAMAMKGANEDVRERIYKNMSERAGRMLRDDLETMGPARLKDIEEIQQKIVNVIRRLEESGEIIIGHGGEEIVL